MNLGMYYIIYLSFIISGPDKLTPRTSINQDRVGSSLGDAL